MRRALSVAVLLLLPALAHAQSNAGGDFIQYIRPSSSGSSLSGLTAGTIPVANSASTVTNSIFAQNGGANSYLMYDSTAVTGVTTFALRAGAGQSSTDFFTLYANDGTTKKFYVNGDGKAAAPGYGTSEPSFVNGSEITTGVSVGGGIVGLTVTASPALTVTSTAISLLHDTTVTGSLYAPTIAGSAASATPTATVLTGGASRSGTDSNVAGAQASVSPGAGTGTGAGAKAVVNRNNMGATGTAAQIQSPAFVACESKTLSNTTGTATAIANVALASNSAGAARITVSVRCNDGTNFDSDIVTSYAAFVNKATVVTVGTAVTTASAAANNSGSCTVAPTWVANGNGIDIKVTPVIGTIVPTTVTAVVNVENFGAGAVTCN